MADVATPTAPAAPASAPGSPPASPPEKPPGTTPAPAEPPKEELSFIERMTGKKLPAKKPAAPAAPAPGKPAAAKPAAAKPPAAPKPVTPPAEPVDYDRLAEAAGRGAAAALAKTQPQGGQPPGPNDDLNPKQKRTLDVLTRMEKEYPENKGLAKDYVESVRKAVQYQKSWEAQHPGETFDADDNQHDEFFKANDVDYDDDEYADTLALIRAEQVAKKEAEAITPKLAAIDRREQLRQAEPEVIGEAINAARGFWSEMGEEFSKVLDEKGNIVNAEVERLRGEDPARDIAFHAAQNVEMFASELHRLTLQDAEGKQLYPYNKNNPLHEFIVNFVADEEAAVQALAPEQQLDDKGRRFATAEEYFKMTPAKQRYYWRFTDTDLSFVFAAREAAKVKAAIAAENEKFEKTASARGYAKADGAGKPAAPERGGTVPAPTVPGPKPSSPAGTVEPRMTPKGNSGANGNETATSSFISRWLGRG